MAQRLQTGGFRAHDPAWEGALTDIPRWIDSWPWHIAG